MLPTCRHLPTCSSYAKEAIEVLGQLRGKGKQLERGQQEYKGNLPNEYVNDVWDVWTWMESRLGGGPEANDPKLKGIMDEVFRLRGEAKKMERIYRPDLEHSDEHMGAGVFANQIVNALYSGPEKGSQIRQTSITPKQYLDYATPKAVYEGPQARLNQMHEAYDLGLQQSIH